MKEAGAQLLAEVDLGGCQDLGTSGLFLHSKRGRHPHPAAPLGLLCLHLFFLLWVAGGSWEQTLPLNPSSNIVLSVFAANQGLLKLSLQPAPGEWCEHREGPRVAQGGCCCRWQWSQQEHAGTTLVISYSSFIFRIFFPSVVVLFSSSCHLPHLNYQ